MLGIEIKKLRTLNKAVNLHFKINTMQEVFVIDAVRTAVGKYGGALANERPDDIAAFILKSLMDRNASIPLAAIEEVVLGAANQAGEDNRNVARMALLLAGFPVNVAGVTVNRLCASGLQAIADAYRAISVGHGDFYVAGGVESMTRAPFVMAKADQPFQRKTELFDTTIGWRFTNPKLSALYHPFSMGETAENVADQWQISRTAQDQFALDSQLKWAKAHEMDYFKDEIIPYPLLDKKGNQSLFDTDEHPRVSSLEKLAMLKPAFKKDGTVTAGNASGVNDGAAAVLLASADAVAKYNLKPMAKVLAVAAAGVDPAIMGVGPIEAVKKAIARAGLTISDIDLMELNEAFASQSLACIQSLDIDPKKVNVNGGAIAIGHPLGASGARITATLLHQMKRMPNAKIGVATMCIGVGQGLAMVFEKSN